METLGRWKPIARARKIKGKEGASRERIMLSRVWLQKGSIALEGDRNGQLRATAFRFWSLCYGHWEAHEELQTWTNMICF